jgi:PIN domain nuclease of toxin-antitoxin system
MELLVDTHTLIWMSCQPESLSPRARMLLEDGDNRVYVSMASFWEMAIKISLGKLDLGSNWMSKLQGFMGENAIVILPQRPKHCTVLATLPFHHRDPFDRMLIAQALAENQYLVSKDQAFTHYDVGVIW